MPFDWMYLGRSVIQLSYKEHQRWYYLTQRGNTWRLRSYHEGDVLDGDYVPELANLPEGVSVLQQLTLQQVNQITGLPATTTRYDDPQTWRQILEALDGLEQQFQAPIHEGPPVRVGEQGPIPSTFLRSMYGTLKLFGSSECHLRMAEDLQRGRNCQLLAERFERSVEHFSRYENVEVDFVPQIPPRRELPAFQEVLSLNRTVDLTAIVSGAGISAVEGAPELSFRYVDRELVIARTIGGARYENGEPATTGVRLDWLLSNANDNTPILAEVKVANDRNPFYALIQLLMYAVEIVTPSQWQRLNRCYPDRFAAQPGVDGQQEKRVDLYIALANYNMASSVRAAILDETQGICQQLSTQGVFRKYVRRLACIDAEYTAPGQVRWLRRFVYPEFAE